MHQRQVFVLPSAPVSAAARCFTALGLALLGGCGIGDGPVKLLDQDPSQIGLPNTKPGDSGLTNGAQYLIDAHKGGDAEQVRILSVSWGRLVDIYDTLGSTGAARLIYPEIVIGESVSTLSGKWTLSTNPVTGRTALVINEQNTSAGDDDFDGLVLEAQDSLAPVLPKGVSLAEAPPFSLVARNSVLVVQFDDLIDPKTLALNDSVRLSVGSPPVTPQDSRLLLDQNHGGISPLDGQFHSTRLIVDLTIDEFEQSALPEPLTLNAAGLPPSSSTQAANVVLRFPTKIDASVGQFEILRNLAGRPLATNNNGPSDLGSSTLDVVRSMRSGNSGDSNNGFMRDDEPPQILGRQSIVISSAVPDPNGQPGYDFVIGFSFKNPSCGIDPQQGDVIQVGPTAQLVVAQQGALSQGLVAALRVSLPATSLPLQTFDLIGEGLFASPWRSELGSALAPCFLRFSPTPEVGVNTAIAPNSQVVFEFSEPISPESVRPFDSFLVRTSPTATGLRDFVVGDVVASPGLREFRFTPLLPFNHTLGTSETYWVNLTSDLPEGSSLIGLGDLAGNPIANLLPQISFGLNSVADTTRSGGLVLRFENTSEDDFPNQPDLRGQFLYNLAKGEILPRPVTHFSLVCDRTIPIVAQMTASTTGLQEPLSNLGSKLHTLWRYCDLGLPQFFITEDSLPNLDVEGIAFSPLGGQVTATFYPQFEMRLGHSDRIPDEVYDPPTLTPFWPASGLFDSATFVENYLADANSGPKVVHTREKGFLVSSSEVFTSNTQTTMVYFPWNRNVAPEDRTYFTWRDTAVQTWGARDITDQGMVQPGVPVTYDVALSSVGFPGDQYGIEIPMINDMGPPPGEVVPPGIPTVGLPLLMEFRCYPGESLSVNSFDVSTLMPVISRPFSRAYSTGGFNQQGTPVIKDPDSETAPTGGFVATIAQGTIGQATLPRDNSLYMGQLDLVTRVSRVHSVLYNTNQPNPDYVGTVMDPRPAAQPLGTQVILAFRGDDAATLPLLDDFADANDLDVYGEPINATNAKFLDNPTWSENISANDNQRMIQLRITFISNPLTELSPRLSGLGIAFRF